MNPRRHRILLFAIVSGVALGLLCGVALPQLAVHFKLLGDLFLRMLKMIVVPLVLTSIMVGISSLGDVRRIGRMGALTLGYYLSTTLIAVCLGIILVTAMQPGRGISLDTKHEIAGLERMGMAGEEGEAPPTGLLLAWRFLLDMLNRMVADNLFDAMARADILPLIVFALILGGVLTTLGKTGENVLLVARGLNDAIMQIVMLVLWFAPVGIFGLVAARFGKEVLAAGGIAGAEAILASLGRYMSVVLLGRAIHAVLFLPMILFFVARRAPHRYAGNMLIALLNAFGSASSSATLPITMECTEKGNRVSPRAAQFVLPLGATINMDGTALYEAVAAIFIAQAYGLELSGAAVVIVAITATLASIGAAGIPEAGLFTMAIVLQAVGLPFEGIELIFVVDWILDRFRTAVNVWGDAVGAAVVERLDAA
ncbi:dicarboxylate/amino acid:cation symporter [bacterium]|nr:dicarboxylate/amino acid:cation symporter [bacterium]